MVIANNFINPKALMSNFLLPHSSFRNVCRSLCLPDKMKISVYGEISGSLCALRQLQTKLYVCWLRHAHN